MGKHASNKYFAVYVYPNDKNQTRLGLSIGKKVGKAVVRNKLRRWVREYFRLYGQNLPSVDIVVVARHWAKELVFTKKFSDVEKMLADLLYTYDGMVAI